MQAVEMIVFFLATVVIAGMVLLFMGHMDVNAIYENVNSLFFPKPFDVNALNKVSLEGFPGLLGECWQQCELGKEPMDCGSIHVNISPDGTVTELTKGYIEGIFGKYSYCTGCNVAVSPESIALPAVVNVNCTQTGLEVNG